MIIVIFESHMVFCDQMLCLYQGPVGQQEMFFKRPIVIPLLMEWHFFRIVGSYVVHWGFHKFCVVSFPTTDTSKTLGSTRFMTQVAGLLNLSRSLPQSCFLLWALLKCVSTFCVNQYISRYEMNMLWICSILETEKAR